MKNKNNSIKSILNLFIYVIVTVLINLLSSYLLWHINIKLIRILIFLISFLTMKVLFMCYIKSNIKLSDCETAFDKRTSILQENLPQKSFWWDFFIGLTMYTIIGIELLKSGINIVFVCIIIPIAAVITTIILFEKLKKDRVNELISFLEEDLEYCKNNNLDRKYSERIEEQIKKMKSEK